MEIAGRFVAFSTIAGYTLADANTAREAHDKAVLASGGADLFVEVLDCGENAAKIIDRRVALAHARKRHKTVFRGAGYERLPGETIVDLPAVPLITENPSP
jgi:hypothetical protein